MNFGKAIEELKKGNRVARTGWNGKEMFLYLVVYDHQTPADINKDNGQPYEYLPYIMMKTAQNGLVPWLASQTDILAEDWEIS